MSEPEKHHVTSARDAADALRALIVKLRGDDPLAPLTVVVPSALAGATLRRSLFPGGLAGVRFTSLPQLVDGVLTAAGQAGARRTGAQRRALVAQALDTSTWASKDYTTSTLRVFDGLMAELDEAEVSSTGDPGVDALYATYRSLLPEDERVLPATRAAGFVDHLSGPVVLYLSRRLAPAEAQFCAALGDRLHVIAIDEPEVTGVQVIARAEPDAEEEVRQAVRAVFTQLEAGGSAERVAIAYRASVPYARLIHEQLHAAGLPHHIPRQRTLGQSLSAGALLGFLALGDDDFRRTDVCAWWHSSPLRSASGKRLIATRWDRLSADAGVTKGRRIWADRLAAALDATGAALPFDEEAVARQQVQLADLTQLAADVQAVVDQHDALTHATSWQEAADLALAHLTAHLGSRAVVAQWGPREVSPHGTTLEVELDAHDQVLEVLATLRTLDQDYRDLVGFRQVLEAELERPLRESRGLGRGVLVAPISDFAGADLDLLLVLGMNEGTFPPRSREHPVLRDTHRKDTHLRTTRQRRDAEKRDFLVALTGAREVVLSYPVADLRSRRGAHPSPWLVELREPQPSASFFTRLQDSSTVLGQSEWDARLLLAAGAGPDHPLAQAEPALAVGLSCIRDRSRGVFGPWTGRVDGLATTPGVSASSLESYAKCPMSFFLKNVLRLRDEDEPSDDLQGSDVGKLVHKALELFFAGRFDQDPATPWSQADHAAAQSLLTTHADELVSRGRAGRPLLWENKLAQMRRSLRTTLLADDVRRRRNRSQPVAAELSFGMEDSEQPAVEVQLEGRTVTLRGSIDRVDRHDDGALTVLDWKTGSGYGYKELKPDDLSRRGLSLQLPLYAAAARAWDPQSVDVDAFYVFVDLDATEKGGSIDEPQQDRFLEVLDVITAGIEAGSFPARPGGEHWKKGWENCNFCAFDRLCPASRGTQWQSISQDEATRAYVELAEPTEGDPA